MHRFVHIVSIALAVGLSEADGNLDEAHLGEQVLLQLQLDHSGYEGEDVRPERSLVGACFSPEQSDSLFDAQGSYLECNKDDDEGCPEKLDAELLSLPRDFALYGYNPSVARLSMLDARWRHLRAALPNATFAMTLRRHQSQCSRLINGSHRLKSEKPLLLFLDAKFCVLAASELKLPSPYASFAEDVRLFVREGNLFASYDLWQQKPYKLRDTSRGFWLAPIVVQSTNDSQKPLVSFLNVPEAVCLGKAGEKNFGLFMKRSQLHAVTWLSVARNQSLLQRASAVHSNKAIAHVWHNNVNLVNLDGTSGDLFGIDHIHRDYNPNVGEHSPFKFGFAYAHRFFTIQGEPPFEKTKISKEFCIGASNGKCESVQFVMSMEALGEGQVLLTYGANDCTAKLALLNVSTISQLLQPVEPGSPVATKRAHEAIPVLRDFAEVLFVAPTRRSRNLRSFWQRTSYSDWFSDSLSLERFMGNFYQEELETCREPAGPYAGWPVCKNWLPRSACVMYDVGEDTSRKAAEGIVAEFGCEAHAFDALGQYVGAISPRQERNNYTSEMQVDSTANGALRENATLASFVAGSVHKRIDLLKIECKGCEWKLLQTLVELSPHALRCVHTVLVRMSMRREFFNSGDAQQSVVEVIRFTRNQSWKIWFATKKEWLEDRETQELEWWLQQGGDGQAYDIGFVNSKFDSNECPN
eukprot:TRINITY_DN7307_c0_g1_i2.p1 TRINITY_DN7307_c0_g1~~TRINITY_DN7307_c0_g1_i2.p1  ORF type:complete len:696 (-),score=88.50 TRINITY_DN7307_c0_g1_i2:220-2307(-)